MVPEYQPINVWSWQAGAIKPVIWTKSFSRMIYGTSCNRLENSIRKRIKSMATQMQSKRKIIYTDHSTVLYLASS